MTVDSDSPAARAQPTPSARRVRLLRLGIITVVVLATVFYLGGGWYFSGQIASTALKVDPATVSLDLRVQRVGGGSITLREDDRHDALHADEVYGLKWATGYGQISGAATAAGKDVTRRFTLVSGTAPLSGAAAGLDRDAFPDAPAVVLGRPVQSVSYSSPLGPMPAWFVNGTSSTWAVLVHGWTASRTEMLRAMRTTVRYGLPSLDITYRNDRGVRTDPSHRYQYGRTEWRDLEAAVGYAQTHGARAVVLVGASMGGGIVASFMERSSRAGIVTALVLDAPMLSFSRAVNLAASRRNLPVVGISVPYSLTWTAKAIAGIRYDLDWSAVDYLDDTEWDGVPTLLFHGDADTRVPISGSAYLARSRPDQVTFVVTHGAAHLESWNRNPSRYDSTLLQFLTAHA